jgi:hypothetical protein
MCHEAMHDAPGGSNEVIRSVSRDDEFAAQKVHTVNGRGLLRKFMALPIYFAQISPS